MVLRHWQALADAPAGINLAARLDRVVADGCALLPRLVEKAQAVLRPWLTRTLPAQTLHGDLWSGNLLMIGDRVAAIIDHAAVRLDSPMADLARLAETDRANVTAGYESVQRFSLAELELLAALAISGPAVRLARWVAWLTVEDKSFPDPVGARTRFAAVLAQARALVG